MRKILIAAAVLVVVAIGAVLFLVSNLDSLVKTAIERVGTRVAGVPVKVGSVKISLREGTGTITGLTVGNPAGFATPTAFALGEISLALDSSSVTQNPIVIRSILVAAPEVTYEIGQNGSNVSAIQRNVQAFTAGGGTSSNAAPASGSSGGAAKKLVIDRLELRNGKVTLATPLPDGKASAPLGDITLTGIGRSGGGATGAQVASQLLQAVSTASIKAVSNLGIGSLVQGATKGIGGAAGTGAASGALGQVKGMFGK